MMAGREDGGSQRAPRYRVNFVFPTKEYERTRTEVLIETFIRKQLRLKAHTVTKVEETDECMLVYIDRLGKRLLRCGVCRSDAWRSTIFAESGSGAICRCGSRP